MTKGKRSACNGILLTLPLLAGFGLFYAVPVGMVLRDSTFHGVGDANRFVGLGNYKTILNNGVFSLALANSLKFLLIALPLAIVVAFAIALFLKSRVKRFAFLKSVLLLPYVMPVAGTVLLVQLFFGNEGGINRVLAMLGLCAADWLDSPLVFWVIILLYLWKNTGYAVILLLSGLVTIPEEHYASASLDGATYWQQLRHITLPQMWYSTFFAGVFSLMNAFKCFREILVIGGEHPHSSVYMLQHFISNVFSRPNYGKLTVAAALLLLILAAVFSMCYAWVVRKEAYKE